MEEIKDFFNTHRAIDKTKFEREMGLPFRSLRDYLNGKQEFPKKHLSKLENGVKKYGG